MEGKVLSFLVPLVIPEHDEHLLMSAMRLRRVTIWHRLATATHHTYGLSFSILRYAAHSTTLTGARSMSRKTEIKLRPDTELD